MKTNLLGKLQRRGWRKESEPWLTAISSGGSGWPTKSPPPTLAKLRQPKTLRRLLLALGPIVVLAGGLFAYTAGGRYVSTDNAYVHAGKLTVATDVSGIVADVAVKESQKVEKGQVLFTLDQEPFRIALAGAGGQSRHRAQPARHPAGDVAAEAGADRAGQDRRRLLRDRLPAPAGPAEARRRLAGGLRPGQARPRRGARARGHGAERCRRHPGAARRQGRRADRAECELPRRAGAGRQGQA